MLHETAEFPDFNTFFDNENSILHMVRLMTLLRLPGLWPDSLVTDWLFPQALGVCAVENMPTTKAQQRPIFPIFFVA